MNRQDAVRKRVAASYTRAVTETSGCGCGCAEATDDFQGTGGVTSYRPEDLAGLPPEVVAASFGCGDPLGMSDVRPGETVLDLGSGAGIDLLLAARRVGPGGRVIGVDMTDAMVDRARKAARDAGAAQVEVRRGLIEELPVEDASVDWVVSNCVINLSPDKPRVFAEIARVLRPGGRVSISDIVVERLPWWMRRLGPLYDSCVGGAISERQYVAGLEAAGLEEVAVEQRLVYDAAQIAAFVEDELPGWLSRILPTRWLLRRLARVVEGRVWSARFSAVRRGAAAAVAGLVATPTADRLHA